MDTFEAKDSIDIIAVVKDIKDLDSKMTEVDKTIADFCLELNISKPF